MKKIFRRIVPMVVVLGMVLLATAVFAKPVVAVGGCPDKCVPVSILDPDGTDDGCSCDSGDGSEIIGVLKLVVKIMTVGIGILAILGIIIVGVQYLTAGSSEEQTRKAKRRLTEIVIGLAVYVLIYALLSFLIPDFSW